MVFRRRKENDSQSLYLHSSLRRFISRAIPFAKWKRVFVEVPSTEAGNTLTTRSVCRRWNRDPFRPRAHQRSTTRGGAATEQRRHSRQPHDGSTRRVSLPSVPRPVNGDHGRHGGHRHDPRYGDTTNAELGSRRDLSALRYVGLHDGGDDGAVRRRLITRGMERRRIERTLAGKIESVWFPMICRASL
jgi:hypothetical protein